MVAASDNTNELPEIHPEVPTTDEGNAAANGNDAGGDVEVELTKEEKLAAIPTLMAEGQRASVTSDYEAAAEKFSIATEYAVSAYGDFAPECYEPHFKYGRALANLALLESEDPQLEFDSVRDYISKMAEERAEKLQQSGAKEQPNLDDSRVGNPDEITGEERDEIVAAVDNALEENAQELEKLAEKSEETMEGVEAATEEAETKKETPKADATVETADNADVDMDKTADIGQDDTMIEEDEEGEDDDVPSANLAWEALEIARKICEKQGESKEWDLKKADVLFVLGELSLFEDKYEEAIGEYQTALELYQKHCDENDRFVASAYYELGNAYSRNDDYLRASELMKKAKEILGVCLENVKAGGDSEKMKELEDVIKDVSAAYEDCQSSYKDSEMKKALKEKEEVKQISPERPKENQEPAEDITSNVRKGKRPAEVEHDEAKKAKVEEEPAAAPEIPTDPVA